MISELIKLIESIISTSSKYETSFSSKPIKTIFYSLFVVLMSSLIIYIGLMVYNEINKEEVHIIVN